MNEIATYSLQNQPSSHIIYIDLDDRFDPSTLIDARLHLFKPAANDIKEFIFSLETWMKEHADIHVLWIMLDGIIDTEIIDILRLLQNKWAFVLLSTTTGILNTIDINADNWDYRFKLKRVNINSSNNNNLLQMELIWPMHMDAFAI
jgi:hypothetical protein